MSPGRILTLGTMVWGAVLAAHGSIISLRDAPGGLGQILEDTYAVPELRIDFLGVRDITTGTYEYQFKYQGADTYQSLMTYCAEPQSLITFGVYPDDQVGLEYTCESADVLTGLSADELHFIEVLWFNAFEDSTTSSTKAAAFQGLIWELVLDDTFDLSSGEFYFGASAAAIQAQAEAYAAQITDQTWTEAQPLVALTHPISQDILIPSHLIPEPSVLGIMLLVGGVFGVRRR